MSHAFQTLLWMLLQYFAPRHNAQIRFLNAQIEILRRRVPTERIVPRPEEKAELLRIGAEFGQQVKPVLEIVKPETYRRWVNDAKRGKQPKNSGRPRLSQDLRALVVRMGKENLLWGYRRIVGELKKLGHAIGHASVRRILIEADVYWVMQQAQNAAVWMQTEGIEPMMLLMDRDTKFSSPDSTPTMTMPGGSPVQTIPGTS